ncbi:MAG TPA: HPF/RaiA family ribosome-associated protein, partial [Thermomicrobiaceae bacterium]|nr:HPF/RaiA family ribosome-associated protein [Thermomicrobiaceae bacterium]
MDVQIKTKNLRLTDSLEAYIRGRVAKLDRVEERVVDAKFEVHPEHNRTGGEQMVAQFTIATRDSILR